MRRADRLFRIVQHLRGGRLLTAAKLAETLEVSQRTVYRDIADLQASGVPIDGEAGVGYILRQGYDLPPLMFTRDEIVALVVGARMVRAWGGASMARAALEALAKIEAVVPPAERAQIARTEIHAPSYVLTPDERQYIDIVNQAIAAHQLLRLNYADEAGLHTQRDVRPLGLWYWGRKWTLVGWCELRADFRMFRLDRFRGLTVTENLFRDEPGKQLADFYRQMEMHAPPPGIS